MRQRTQVTAIRIVTSFKCDYAENIALLHDIRWTDRMIKWEPWRGKRNKEQPVTR